MEKSEPQDWSKRAVDRLWSATTEAERNQAILALFNLYRLGDRKSGYELAIVSQSWLPLEVTLSRDERASLILEQALAGDSMAALELAHSYWVDAPREQLRLALIIAASEGSGEAEELLQAL